MQVMTENKVAPKLRFGEYNDSWEKKKLGDVGKVKMCKRIFSNQTTEKGDIPFYKIGTFGKVADAFIDIDLYNEFKLKFSYPKVGEILMSASGTLGRTIVFDGSPSYYQDSNIVWLENNEELITNNFLYYIYQIVRFDSEGGTIQRLYNSIILNTKFHKPSLPEQQKIASFLSAVDEKIQQLTKKKRLLEEYKKGLMQKIFSQELCFKNDNGNNYPDWEKKNLGEIFDYKNGGSFEKEVVENGKYNLVTLNSIDIEGKLKPTHKKVNITDNSLNKGDIIMVLSDVAHGNFLGLTAIIPNDEFVLNQRMGALKRKTNDNLTFINQYINFNQKYFKLHGQGSSQQNLSKGDILKFKMYLPILEEQQKIANFLTSLDGKIELVSTQIENTKAFKKGLLQQMFV
jgi:type I restriction enzyme, S subunit